MSPYYIPVLEIILLNKYLLTLLKAREYRRQYRKDYKKKYRKTAAGRLKYTLEQHTYYLKHKAQIAAYNKKYRLFYRKLPHVRLQRKEYKKIYYAKHRIKICLKERERRAKLWGPYFESRKPFLKLEKELTKLLTRKERVK